MVFADRADAGRRLAARLQDLRDKRVVVLGLPRGGVPVAVEVARALGAPLDVIVVRKLGVPFQPELGMGAIGEGGVRVINDEVVRLAGVSGRAGRGRGARTRRAGAPRPALPGDRPRQPLDGRIAVVVDDGIATGSTARAACQVARAQGAARVVLAVPVAPPGWKARMGRRADESSAWTPRRLLRHRPVLRGLLPDIRRRGRRLPASAPPRPVPRRRPAQAGRTIPPVRDEEVEVQPASTRLAGHLTLPERALGIVVFAHGSGSSRHSPRNRYVATVLNQAGLGTLLFDLLTTGPRSTTGPTCSTSACSPAGLSTSPSWLRTQADAEGLPIGYFGASTGAAAALWAAAEPGAGIAAVVSRGGRPDLAGPRLAR